MSRKSLMSVLAVISAVLAFFSKEFGLALDSTAVLAGVTAVLCYVLFEAKLDLKKLSMQIGRFKDPKFILAFISAILVAVSEAFGLELPVEAIVAVLTVIMGVLFKAEFNKAKSK